MYIYISKEKNKQTELWNNPWATNCNLRRVLRVCLDSFVVFMIFRELMLISHQKSMEQLQETLRQKMLNGDNWREKVTIMWLSAACVLFVFKKFCLFSRLLQIGLFASMHTFDSFWNFLDQTCLQYMFFTKY